MKQPHTDRAKKKSSGEGGSTPFLFGPPYAPEQGIRLFDDFLKYVAKYNPSLLKYWSLGYDYYIKMSKKKYFIKLKIC